MIVETSAVIAVIKDEPDGPLLVRCLASQIGVLKISAANYVEAGIVVDAVGSEIASWKLDELIRVMGIEIVPVSAGQATLARETYNRFGKGRGHPAQLNFGDCFAMALSLETGERLLYKGEDFRRAGVRNALDDFIAH